MSAVGVLDRLASVFTFGETSLEEMASCQVLAFCFDWKSVGSFFGCSEFVGICSNFAGLVGAVDLWSSRRLVCAFGRQFGQMACGLQSSKDR
ncbi:hypothetical protein BpHYR1_034802 [Brachionus plicatilis]|uniref:Uncharacterized protein n=1 Tax=Brachionus plicatilis TaxID=10195 RepID=A0A3M7SQK0_BRAPC|nr:hypothetical protein BpHYR1_034802 [Brachionus plicatilis]